MSTGRLKRKFIDTETEKDFIPLSSPSSGSESNTEYLDYNNNNSEYSDSEFKNNLEANTWENQREADLERFMLFYQAISTLIAETANSNHKEILEGIQKNPSLAVYYIKKFFDQQTQTAKNVAYSSSPPPQKKPKESIEQRTAEKTIRVKNSSSTILKR